MGGNIFAFAHCLFDLKLPRLSQKAAASPGLLESTGGLSWHFESYLLVPGCHTFLILHGIAETFRWNAELA